MLAAHWKGPEGLIFAYGYAILDMTQCVIVMTMPYRPTLYSFVARNGSTIRVRPIMPEDAPYLVDLFENMGPDSRYRRFMQTLEHIDMERLWSEAEQIASGMAVNSRGFIAFCDTAERPDVPVGAVRYVRLASGDAELGISVRDDMQGLGVGTELTQVLTDEAEVEGVERLVGVVQNDNAGIWSVLRRLNRPLDYKRDGNTTTVTILLGETQSDSRPVERAVYSDESDEMDAAADYSPEPQFVG